MTSVKLDWNCIKKDFLCPLRDRKISPGNKTHEESFKAASLLSLSLAIRARTSEVERSARWLAGFLRRKRRPFEAPTTSENVRTDGDGALLLLLLRRGGPDDE